MNKNEIPSTVDAAKIDSTVKYQTQGLLAVTNDVAVVPRNDVGAISIEDGATTPTILVVEPMIKRVTTKSVLKVVNTQFNYYKFPARTALEEEPELDLDLDFSILEEIDPIFARYMPSGDRKILANSIPSGILMDEVEDGLLQRKSNRYYISKAINDLNKPLRFRIKLTTRFISTDNSLGDSREQFTLIKSNSNGIDRYYAGPFNMPGSDANGKVKNGTTNVLELDIVLQPDQFTQGDMFGIGAWADHNNSINSHTIIAQESYWSITDATKQVDSYNNPETVIPVQPVVTTEPVTTTEPATSTETSTQTNIMEYYPFGTPGDYDGESRTFTAGGTINEVYEWSVNADTWNKL